MKKRGIEDEVKRKKRCRECTEDKATVTKMTRMEKIMRTIDEK